MQPQSDHLVPPPYKVSAEEQDVSSKVESPYDRILHYHQDLTDSLDLECIVNEYVAYNEARKSTFATFNL